MKWMCQCTRRASHALTAADLVSGVIVHDDVDVQPLRDTPVDLLQEVEELPGPVASVALADDAARGDVEGCEERGRAVTLVVVCAALGHARQHRQDRLCAIECLDLALFIDTEHQRAVRRRQIEAYDVADLVHEQRIAGELEGLRAVRLHAEGRPYPPDRRVRQPALRAIERSDQWVASAGVVSSVRSMTAATFSSESVRGRPGRGSSDSPSMRSFRKRRRHLPTVCSCTPISGATALLVRPSAQRRIMRQRSDSERATRRRRA